MAVRRDRWLDQTSLNAVRFVLGSYLCAVALGLPSGVDPIVIFGLFQPADVAQRVGSTVWFTLSVIFVFGIMLRVTTLILVALVVSSAIATFVLGDGDLGAVWNSVAFAASLLLCYASLRPYEMHKAALFPMLALRGSAARAMQKEIVPRRVKLAKQPHDQSDDPSHLRRLRPVIAPTEQMMGMSDRVPQRSRVGASQKDDLKDGWKDGWKDGCEDDWPEDEILNIFAQN